MSSNLTQPEEIDIVLREFSDFLVESEHQTPQTKKSKPSRELSDDEYYIPLYKASYFN